MKMMKRYLAMIACLWTFVALSAQTLTGEAPNQVAVGQQFRLTYKVNTHDVSNFKMGAIPSDAFEVVMGPSTSTQSHFSVVNGKTTKTSTITYTYIISALKNGSFTIPAASITAEGKQISSNEVRIVVSGKVSEKERDGGKKGTSSTQTEGTPVKNSDLFIKVTASKQHVVEQEPVLLTYKVYSLVTLTQLEGKMPDLKDFHVQEIPLPQQKSFKTEEYDGRNYNTVTWSQYVITPQRSGKLQIPPVKYNGVVVQKKEGVDPFEEFMNGGSGCIEVKKQIQAPGVDITVDPLPQQPESFSGGVGTFSMNAIMRQSKASTGDSLHMTVTISGIGNLMLLDAPKIQFPGSFECFEPVEKENTTLTTNGLSGSITFDYLVVPHRHGTFEIPAIEYAYFDLDSRTYKILTSQPFSVDVEGEDDDFECADDGVSLSVNWEVVACVIMIIMVGIVIFVLLRLKRNDYIER